LSTASETDKTRLLGHPVWLNPRNRNPEIPPQNISVWTAHHEKSDFSGEHAEMPILPVWRKRPNDEKSPQKTEGTFCSLSEEGQELAY